MPSPFASSEITPIVKANDNAIDSLLSISRWASGTISYSFPASNDPLFWSSLSGGYGFQFGDGEPWNSAFVPLTMADQANFVNALQQWANIANLNFVQVSETPSEVGDIRAAYTEDPDKLTLAWTYLPSPSTLAGDIWINTKGLLRSQEWGPGSISFETILHELGHALGLKHPFLDPDDPSQAVLPANLDNTSYTVMSYTYSNLEGDVGTEFSFHPTTPMVLDISAIQFLYGPNNLYHVANDTYTFDDANTYHETIWDAGGSSDTIRYTGIIPSLIDLNPASASQIGQPVYVQSNGVNIGSPIHNIWIADNVTIENAIGGQGNDIFIGNGVSNSLDGGSGIDTVLIKSMHNQFTLNKISGGYLIATNAEPGNQDTLLNIERVKFDDIGVALDLNGNAGEVAKLLGAVFGASVVTNPEYAGIGLAKADAGLSYEQLGEFAIHATKFTRHDEIVTLLWQNLFGTVPTQNEKSPYVNMLDSGEISVGSLAMLAADSEVNAQNIHFTELMQTGLMYI
ncbi:M10 family metallopeptidase [Nitrosomonas supralitoralis]|uniref:Peptidase M10 n=1 Tax=Nitrosomonas supralitoralis TaxID=2116706 RepID=A0A2P7NRW3_9PROT|nr:M10 family metallopeptidase [Nitrosomonas supralitoralis]PSJ16189.1 peptidase M10 [Nitrosomonas supralitoralis]